MEFNSIKIRIKNQYLLVFRDEIIETIIIIFHPLFYYKAAK